MYYKSGNTQFVSMLLSKWNNACFSVGSGVNLAAFGTANDFAFRLACCLDCFIIEADAFSWTMHPNQLHCKAGH